jgi:hypothetical protein
VRKPRRKPEKGTAFWYNSHWLEDRPKVKVVGWLEDYINGKIIGKKCCNNLLHSGTSSAFKSVDARGFHCRLWYD